MRRHILIPATVLLVLGLAVSLSAKVPLAPIGNAAELCCEPGTEGFTPCPVRQARLIESLPRYLKSQEVRAAEAVAGGHACPTADQWWDEFLAVRDADSICDQPQTWTVLFYDDADFPNAYDPFMDFNSGAYSAPNLNVLILRDSKNKEAGLYSVNEHGGATLLEEWGEVNMGGAATLRDFVAYGKAHFPADRYLLAVYDHGAGYYGSCLDITNSGWLLMKDMRTALTEAGGVDILAFTAPCLMGAVESAYEAARMRGSVHRLRGPQRLRHLGQARRPHLRSA